MLLMIPARLVISGIPMSITPATLACLALGVIWFCCQLVTTLGVAKGRNLARTALFLYAISQLATYGYATRNYLPMDELEGADRTIVVVFGTICVGIAVCDGVKNFGAPRHAAEVHDGPDRCRRVHWFPAVRARLRPHQIPCRSWSSTGHR
ncbi:hypothetical protein [Kibdelosporangium aridum]|uniref:hypothetical protein n=1 Tax=Kibdelosporangium aridum TaxID=2030 RepID=UPI0035E93D75